MDETGKWSLKAIFDQTPEAVKDTVMLVVVFILAALGLDPDMWQVGAGGAALLAVLNLFYARPKRIAAQEAEVLKGIDLGRSLGRQRPLVAEEPED